MARADPHPLGLEVVEQPLGDRRAQPLERAVGALLRDQRDGLADLGVVDRVLDPVGHRRVDLPHLEPQVDDQSLADLALRLGDAVVGVERQAGYLDDDLGLAGPPRRLVVVVGVVEFVRLVGSSAAQRSSRHRERVARSRATSWTRKIEAPRSSASTFVATVPDTRWSGRRAR